MPANNENNIPLYLFTGFLEAGKTCFIQQTLEDQRFNTGDSTLVVLCEEGEAELETSSMASKDVKVVTVESIEEIQGERFLKLIKDSGAKRIMLEYNGMWQLQDFFNQLPDEVMIYQEICIADASTFLNYNSNMRSLVVDKLTTAELIIFNRYSDSIDMMSLHKICRGISRQINIAYEYTDGRVKYDDIQDPLPFDVNAQTIKIEDRDYALWYRDLMEDPKKYNGKEMTFKGIVAVDANFPPDSFAVGRHVMTCCVEDIQYMAIAAEWASTATLSPRDWVIVKGKLSYEKSKLYKGKGPVLKVTEVIKTSAPQQEVATFY